MLVAIVIRATFLIYCSVLTLQSDIFDTFEPVLRVSPEINATTKDLFGYTLVLHQLDVAGGVDNTRVVVSAPYGQAAGTQLPRAINDDPTGVIYTCTVGPGQCVGLTGDGNGNDRRLYDIDDNVRINITYQAEEKRGQFLGSTLKSTGNTFLVCGHRYLDYGNGLDRNPYGICYISGRSLSGFQRYHVCSRTSRSFFGHGQCQAGTAGDIINGNVLVGAPGTFAWRGAVFRHNNTGARSFSSNGVGSGSISWQGYEVITGRIFSPDFDFIVSVPRFNNYLGRVNIYPNNGELRPEGNSSLTGEQIGAYYGYSMAAADFQQQGMDDLLISAPMYSPDADKPEYGRVYVYRNNQSSLSLSTKLDGRIPFGRFGHAMAKLGDINGDSLEDVAISAPFGDQPGTVYIYACSTGDILSLNLIQTIIGSSLNLPQLTGLRSFGASLSSSVDVDNNGYNDLAVGAYLSQKIFVLRSRPTAKLEVILHANKLFFDNQTVQHCNNRPCFSISSCFMYGGTSIPNTLQISYVLSADANAQGRPSRVRLTHEIGPTSTGKINGTLTLMKGQQMCVNTTAIINEGVPYVSQGFEVEFTPTLVNNRTYNPAWDGNMSLSSLESAPVLSVVGNEPVQSIFIPMMRRSTRSASNQTDELCGSATSCTDCIRLSADCVWCTQPNYTTTTNNQHLRCVRRDADHGCDPNFIEDPSGSTSTVVSQSFGGDNFVQVSPQRFRVNLRPGQAQNITVSIRPANNISLDVYFLMDQSFSMNDDLQNITKLASQLASTISSITENFQLGFGSFVDKQRVPYISVETARLADPCQEDGVICEPSYSFRHTINLTSDANLFVERIQDEIISGNLDSPEGGFDAMLQVIVCQNIIGWRKNARHILVYLTDAGFHFAGDGKLGGVVIPHDGQCYLEQRDNVFQYTMAETLDYPSVGHIRSLLKKFDIIPIFGAEAAAESFYNNLTQVLEFAFVGRLAADSSNIVDLIRDTYNTASQTIRLIPDTIPGFTVEVTPLLCQNFSAESSACMGVTLGQTVSFRVTLTAQLCTDELMNGRNLTIRIPGFGQVVVEMAGVCECSCTNNPVDNSDFCNNRNGDLVCGQCVCDPGWFGDTCQCDSSNTSLSEEGCPVGPNGIACTSEVRGTCICGVCECSQLDGDRRFSGPACECDNFSSDQDQKCGDCTGVGCDNDTDQCSPNPCQNGETCVDFYTGNNCSDQFCVGFDVTWDETQAGITVPCTGHGLNGTIHRRCKENHLWEEHNNCFRQEIRMLLQRATNLTLFINELNETEAIAVTSEIANTLVNITASTEEPIFAQDVNLTVNILSTLNNITETFVTNLTANDTVFEDTASVIDNLLSDTNQDNWRQLEMTSPSTSQDLVSNAEQITRLLSETLTNNDTEAIITRPNIIIKAERVSNDSVQKDYVFPDEEDNLTAYTGGNARLTVSSSLLQNITTGSEELTIASTVIRNNSGLSLPSANNRSKLPVSPIFSLQINPLPDAKTLKENPIMMTFDVDYTAVLLKQTSVENVQDITVNDLSCNFYNYTLVTNDNLNQIGSWSTEGLTVDESRSNKTLVTCLTTHLTSFAVLVSIQDERPPSPADEALSIISYIGCSISLVCLCISIIFLSYAIYKVKDNKNNLFIHLNLCIALALGIVVFIGGIENATTTEESCKVVAALLHYFFTSAFCWMLCEGIMLYMKLVTVFGNRLNNRRFFFILGWGPAILIVSISAGLTHEHYGTENYCWIKSDDGAIAAFIAPIVVIMLINCIFLGISLKVLWQHNLIKAKMIKQVSSNTDSVKNVLRAAVILLPLLGITWIIGIFAVNNETQVFAWIFAILNSLQGVFIFVLHVIRNEQVAEVIRECYNSMRKSAVFSRLVSICGSGHTCTSGISSKTRTSQNTPSEKNTSTTTGGDKTSRISLKEDSIDDQIKLTAFKKVEEAIIEESSAGVVVHKESTEEDRKSTTEEDGAATVAERNDPAATIKE